MADDQTLSTQDIKDLQEISTKLPAGHPTQQKISTLLNSQPTQFEKDRGAGDQQGRGFFSGVISNLGLGGKSSGKQSVGESVKNAVASEPPVELGRAAWNAISNAPRRLSEGWSGAVSQNPVGKMAEAAGNALAPVAGVNPEAVRARAERGDVSGVAGELAAPAAAAVAPLAGAATKGLVTSAAEKAAPAVANKMLRPVPTQLEKAARFGRNPGQAIADEGIIATSHSDLVGKIAAKKEQVGGVIGDQLSGAAGAGKTLDVRPLIEKPINDAIQDVVDGKIEGGQAMIDKLEEVRNTYLNKRELKDGKLAVTGPKDTVLPVDKAHTLKRQIGDNTKWSEDELTQAANDVKRNIYQNLNDGIESAVPGIKKDQMRYGNLLEAERAAERESARQQARNPFGLLDMIAGASTGGGILAHGGDPLTAAGLGAGTALASKAVRSPLFRSLEVQGLKNVPKALSPDMLQAARNALAIRNTSQQ